MNTKESVSTRKRISDAVEDCDLVRQNKHKIKQARIPKENVRHSQCVEKNDRELHRSARK